MLSFTTAYSLGLCESILIGSPVANSAVDEPGGTLLVDETWEQHASCGGRDRVKGGILLLSVSLRKDMIHSAINTYLPNDTIWPGCSCLGNQEAPAPM